MKFIGYLRGLSLGYALSSENATFEQDHVQDVAHYSEMLAFKRNLDLNIALAIAYGHDLGRTKLGVVGKDHARVSARFMKALMLDSEFDDQTQSVIASAIKRHNLKSKCHGVYAELIKDADALAHQNEGLIDEDNPVELYRVLISNMETLSIIVAPFEVWRDQFEAHRESFLKNMNQLSLFKDDSRHWIHEQRKNVRKLRSMIWYLDVDDLKEQDTLSELDRLLKAFFSDLSEARMYQVQMDYLNTMENLQSALTREEKQQILENKLMRAQALIESRLINGYYDSLKGVLNDPMDVDASHFEDRVLNQKRWMSAFASYQDKAIDIDPKKLKPLHKLRILGKNFKYMSNLGLIQFSQPSIVTVIEQLHDQIGALNDLGDILDMNEWQAIYDASLIEAETKSIQKICKNRLFFFVKLNQMIENEHIKITLKE
jgi:ribosomal protein L25 (general stress protein Ctc)